VSDNVNLPVIIYQASGKKMTTTADYPFSDSLIRLIPFPAFKEAGQIPRYPPVDDKNVKTVETILLKDLTLTQYQNSLFVFVSHRWLTEHDPDNEDHVKYNLCVKGIEDILRFMAPGMETCYIWIDYACIDQSKEPAEETRKSLKDAIRICDCMFTPIYDPDHESWEFKNLSPGSDPYDDYKSSGWEVYRGRGWCRVEMWYAATVELWEDKDRHSKFAYALQTHHLLGKRTHFLYGTKEANQSESHPPRPLPFLQNSYIDKYNPSEGNYFDQTDREKVDFLFKEIRPLIKDIVASYNGKRNHKGEKHGKGKEIELNGSEYEGSFQCDKKHGNGKLLYSRGDCYEGDFENDNRHGRGVHLYGNGRKYHGDFLDNNRHGKGIMTSSHHVYDGDYFENKKHGQAKLIYPDGRKFSCRYENDKLVEDTLIPFDLLPDSIVK
jgi:hypothetical protein